MRKEITYGNVSYLGPDGHPGIQDIIGGFERCVGREAVMLLHFEVEGVRTERRVP